MRIHEGTFASVNSTGFHTIHYRDVGPADGPIVLCVHYLTGNARYFDALASALVADGFRVIAPDLPGRGKSDDLPLPADYNFRQYIVDLTALLAHVNAREVHWVGASLGGLLGITFAALNNTPVRSLTLIDIGPFIPSDELQRIASLRKDVGRYDTLEDAEATFKADRAPVWGKVPEGYWRDFTRNGVRITADGKYTEAYDPALTIPFAENAVNDVNLWPLWDNIRCGVLAIRGGLSKTFPGAVAREMLTRGPKVTLHTLDDCGHVPSMAMPGQIDLVRDFLK